MVMPVPESGIPAAQGFARAVGHPLRRRAGEEPLRRPHVHPAEPEAARRGRAAEAQPAAREHPGQAARRRRRLDRARHHHAAGRRDAARGRRGRGALPGVVAAVQVARASTAWTPAAAPSCSPPTCRWARSGTSSGSTRSRTSSSTGSPRPPARRPRRSAPRASPASTPCRSRSPTRSTCSRTADGDVESAATDADVGRTVHLPVARELDVGPHATAHLRRGGRRHRGGREGRRADQGPRAVDVPARGGRRHRRLRRAVLARPRSTATTRCSCRRPTASAPSRCSRGSPAVRHDRHRLRRRCRPTTSPRRAPSRCSSSTTSRWASSCPTGRRRSSPGSPTGCRRGRLRAARRRDVGAPRPAWTPGSSTSSASPSAWSSGARSCPRGVAGRRRDHRHREPGSALQRLLAGPARPARPRRALARRARVEGRATTPSATSCSCPSVIYAPALLDAARATVAVHAFVHVTGGGIPGNLVRVLPPHCDAVVRRGTWDEPRIFSEIQRAGDVADDEMEHVFNLGRRHAGGRAAGRGRPRRSTRPRRRPRRLAHRRDRRRRRPGAASPAADRRFVRSGRFSRASARRARCAARRRDTAPAARGWRHGSHTGVGSERFASST